MSEKLVTPKIISFQINPRVMVAINHYAEALGLYDDKFEEENQCTGYYAFKELCLMREELPSIYIVDKIGTVGRNVDYSIHGVYLLAKLHKNIRKPALSCVRDIRNHIFNLKNKKDE